MIKLMVFALLLFVSSANAEHYIKNTVSAMVAASYVKGDSIKTLGYAMAGDGGGHDYFIVTSKQYLAKYGGSPDNIGDHSIGNLVAEVNKTPFISAASYGMTKAATDVSIALNAVAKISERLNGTKAVMPAGSYPVLSSSIVGSGFWLDGAGAGTANNPKITGTTLVVGANLSSVFSTDKKIQNNYVKLSNFTIDCGSKKGYKVDRAIDFSGVNIRIYDITIYNTYGDGVYLSTGKNPPYTWVNWIGSVMVANAGGHCIHNESSDSYIVNNYFTHCGKGSVSNISGGNIWSGNHFDHTTSGYAGLKVVRDSRYLSMSDRFIGNYFDRNDRGLWIDGGSDLGKNTNDNLVIDNNRFRANESYDVVLEKLNYPTISGGQFSFSRQKAAILFVDVVEPRLNNLELDVGYPVMAHGAPKSLRVRNLQWGDKGSEKSGQAMIKKGKQRITIPHYLYKTPNTVIPVSAHIKHTAHPQNRTEKTFDVVLDSPAQKDVPIFWQAMATP